MKNVLTLNVKDIYYSAFKSGKKIKEYRLYNDYWIKRLVGKDYDFIHYKSGYPKNGDHKKISVLKYKGYCIETINHPHFGDKDVKVFSIYLT